MHANGKLTIGVVKETTPGERRIAVVPDVAKRYLALQCEMRIEAGAGSAANLDDAEFSGTTVCDSAADILGNSAIILKVAPPNKDEIESIAPGAVLVGFMQAYLDLERVRRLAERNVTCFAVELIPRISRAQSMDALSSQAALSGYLSAVIAAENSSRVYPLMTYAAGTLRPAKVMVVGAGVAGLQAIATSKRMGAIVSAYDVRPETREQIESLGAKFVDAGVSAAGSGGYARELTVEERSLQRANLGKAVSQVDVLITTAAIPGRQAPLIIDADMLSGMKAGAVVVDMAAESGGNVAGTQPGKTVELGQKKLLGPVNLPSQMAPQASEMYAKNLHNFVSLLIKNGRLELDWNDEIVAAACLTHGGRVMHAGVRTALGLSTD